MTAPQHTHDGSPFRLGRDRARRAERAAALQRDDGRFDALRSTRARRFLVAGGYLLAATAGALAWAGPDGAGGVIVYVMFLAGLGVYYLLRRAVRNTDDAPAEALDERLIAMRDTAYRRAYRMVITVTLAAVLALLIGLGDTVEARHIEALFVTFALVAAMTPAAMIAWSQDEL